MGTQENLRGHSLDIPVIGDPGVLVRIIVKKSSRAPKKILIPHLHDHTIYNAADVGCDSILSPLVSDQKELIELIRKISSASFVLAGSLHAAVVASAYRVPFALFKTNYLDCPPKWFDWASSIALAESNVLFHHSAYEGEQWYCDVQSDLQPTLLTPLLAAAEAIGAIRRSAKLQARAHDLESGLA